MGDLIETSKHKDLINDIGMHKGEDAEFYLRKGFRVIGFEAEPDLIRFCENRLKEYIDQGQLTIIEGAIIDPGEIDARQKRVQFYKNDDISVFGTVSSTWAERNARMGASSSLIEVDAINFANAIQEHGVPHYMKIDIEGSDMVCIEALRKFRERPDYISVESDKTSFMNIRREIDALNDLGYAHFQAVEQSQLHLSQSPPHPSREGKYAAQQFEQGSSGLFGSELDDNWKSKNAILRQYLAIRLGYFLLGDDGIMNQWKIRGAERLRWRTRHYLSRITKADVPGWYDTHARHYHVNSRKD